MKTIAFLFATLAGINAIAGGVPIAGVFAFIAAVFVVIPVQETS